MCARAIVCVCVCVMCDIHESFRVCPSSSRSVCGSNCLPLHRLPQQESFRGSSLQQTPLFRLSDVNAGARTARMRIRDCELRDLVYPITQTRSHGKQGNAPSTGPGGFEEHADFERGCHVGDGGWWMVGAGQSVMQTAHTEKDKT